MVMEEETRACHEMLQIRKEVNRLLWYFRLMDIFPVVVIATGLIFPIGIFLAIFDIYKAISRRKQSGSGRAEVHEDQHDRSNGVMS